MGLPFQPVSFGAPFPPIAPSQADLASAFRLAASESGECTLEAGAMPSAGPLLRGVGFLGRVCSALFAELLPSFGELGASAHAQANK